MKIQNFASEIAIEIKNCLTTYIDTDLELRELYFDLLQKIEVSENEVYVKYYDELKEKTIIITYTISTKLWKLSVINKEHEIYFEMESIYIDTLLTKYKSMIDFHDNNEEFINLQLHKDDFYKLITFLINNDYPKEELDKLTHP